MKKTGVILGILLLLLWVWVGSIFYATHKMNQPVSNIGGYKVMESLYNVPGTRTYFTEWKFSHKEKFFKAVIEKDYWRIFTVRDNKLSESRISPFKYKT